MHSSYQKVLSLLDQLTAQELISLLEQITVQLKPHIISIQEDLIEDQEIIPRRYLPRLPQMIQWGLVIPIEDTLYIKDSPDHPALLLDANRVAYQGETMSINEWAKDITGWKGVNIYEWVVVKRLGRTLDDLRQSYIDDNDLD